MPGRSVAAARTFRRNWSGVKFKRHSDSAWKQKARRGFHILSRLSRLTGPDDARVTKAAVAILNAQGVERAALERWFTGEGDVRTDPAVGGEILRFVQAHGTKRVVATDRVIGCPHQEGGRLPRRKGLSALPVLGAPQSLDRR